MESSSVRSLHDLELTGEERLKQIVGCAARQIQQFSFFPFCVPSAELQLFWYCETCILCRSSLLPTPWNRGSRHLVGQPRFGSCHSFKPKVSSHVWAGTSYRPWFRLSHRFRWFTKLGPNKNMESAFRPWRWEIEWCWFQGKISLWHDDLRCCKGPLLTLLLEFAVGRTWKQTIKEVNNKLTTV